MPLSKFYGPVVVLIFLVMIDIFLTLGGRERGLNIIERLGRIESNQAVVLNSMRQCHTR